MPVASSQSLRETEQRRASWKAKGKERALPLSLPKPMQSTMDRRDEGNGGAGGIVLPLDMVGTGVYDVAYTLPVKFGESGQQQFSLQVDTGSSDLWVASTSCSTSSCKLTQGRLYDPSNSNPTNVAFSISYLQGLAAGPVVWEKVSVGGYEISSQAMAAANDVQSEPLGPKFSGILGLALPLNSIIAEKIPPVTGNAPDGAAWASNLFSITPVSQAPAARFLSLSLARPDSDRIPSLLGIGRHPSALVPDPSKINYRTLVSERSGTLFWKASIRGISVYVDGVEKAVDIGRSNTGSVFPSAVLDSGVPLILTTTMIANGIYGAIGVSPASDGMYYVPCNKPLNITITVDDRPPIPLHPLDLTAEPPTDNKAQFCVGLIQTADVELSSPASSIGDMILGVPFLRNVYTVMAYTIPDPTGSFTGNSGDIDDTNDVPDPTIRPRLGLMALTDPTTALSEFNTVRVLNQALPPSSTGSTTSGTSGSTNSDANTRTINFGGKKLSVGIIILISLMSFFALCAVVWGARWLYYRKKFKKGAAKGAGIYDDMSLDQKAAYQLARRGSSGLGGGAGMPVSTMMAGADLRETRSRSYARKEGSTLSGSTIKEYVGYGDPEGDEFGFRKKRVSEEDDDTWNPSSATSWRGTEKDGDKTVVAGERGRKSLYEPLSASEADPSGPVALVLPDTVSSPPTPLRHDFLPQDLQQQAYIDQYSSPPSSSNPLPNEHRQTLSVDRPLLPAGHRHVPSVASVGSDEGLLPSETYIVQEPRRYSIQRESDNNRTSYVDQPKEDAEVDEQDDLGELGIANGVSMAGVGSASRTSKLSTLSLAPAFRDSNRIDISSSSFSSPQVGPSAARESVFSMSSYGSGVGISSRIEEEDTSPSRLVLHSDLIERISRENLDAEDVPKPDSPLAASNSALTRAATSSKTTP
ncbi:acid protease [Agrocybe pediades]|nr:acid protease [Agrocybe pediades]